MSRATRVFLLAAIAIAAAVIVYRYAPNVPPCDPLGALPEHRCS